jgi:hypothetical protein
MTTGHIYTSTCPLPVKQATCMMNITTESVEFTEKVMAISLLQTNEFMCIGCFLEGIPNQILADKFATARLLQYSQQSRLCPNEDIRVMLQNNPIFHTTDLSIFSYAPN